MVYLILSPQVVTRGRLIDGYRYLARELSSDNLKCSFLFALNIRFVFHIEIGLKVKIAADLLNTSDNSIMHSALNDLTQSVYSGG